MGIIQHDAVIATTWDDEAFSWIENWIASLFEGEKRFYVVSPSIVMNHYRTVILVPDGSKEGWPDSEIGNARRERFIALLTDYRCKGDYSPWDWVEVSWGECGTSINRHNREL